MHVKQDNEGIHLIGLATDTPLNTPDGSAFVEYEVEDSERWCAEGAEFIAKKVRELVLNSGFLTELRVRAGKTWIVRKIVTGRDFIGE